MNIDECKKNNRNIYKKLSQLHYKRRRVIF